MDGLTNELPCICLMFHIFLPQIHGQRSHWYEYGKISFVRQHTVEIETLAAKFVGIVDQELQPRNGPV